MTKRRQAAFQYGNSVVSGGRRRTGFSYKFEQEANDSKKIEVERCYAVHKDYLQNAPAVLPGKIPECFPSFAKGCAVVKVFAANLLALKK